MSHLSKHVLILCVCCLLREKHSGLHSLDQRLVLGNSLQKRNQAKNMQKSNAMSNTQKIIVTKQTEEMAMPKTFTQT